MTIQTATLNKDGSITDQKTITNEEFIRGLGVCKEEAECEDIEFYDDYSEPGYSLGEGKKGVALANWNNVAESDLLFYNTHMFSMRNYLDSRGVSLSLCISFSLYSW